MGKPVSVMVLCEDKRHRAFFERALKGLGYGRQLRSKIAPEGHGAGEQFVRSSYPQEVRALRTSHHACCLVVAIDADADSVENRLRQLDRELTSGGIDARRPEEAVALFVPRRSIETWVSYLLGNASISEDDPAPRVRRDRDCSSGGEHFAGLVRQRIIPEGCLPSLTLALQEEAPRLP